MKYFFCDSLFSRRSVFFCTYFLFHCQQKYTLTCTNRTLRVQKYQNEKKIKSHDFKNQEDNQRLHSEKIANYKKKKRAIAIQNSSKTVYDEMYQKKIICPKVEIGEFAQIFKLKHLQMCEYAGMNAYINTSNRKITNLQISKMQIFMHSKIQRR